MTNSETLSTPMGYYTGVGSRETPPDMMLALRRLATRLAQAGWVLRSGGAEGADTAFEDGCDDVEGRKEIYLPWMGFNDRDSSLYTISRDALDLAATVHPAWERLSTGPRKLHARNCYQVLGQQLSEPSSLVLCWTADGCEQEGHRTSKTGGTATAIVLAARNGIPVFNLRRPASRHRLVEHLASLGVDIAKSVEALRPPQAGLFEVN